MELIFSYMSGLGELIDKILSALNENSKEFFKKKSYSDSIDRVMFILITKNLIEEEKREFRVKYVKTERVIAISFYLSSVSLQKETLKNNLLYIGFVILNSLKKNHRLKKLDLNFDQLTLDTQFFFESVLLKDQYKINIVFP